MGSDLSEIQQLDILLRHTVSRLPYMVEHLRSDCLVWQINLPDYTAYDQGAHGCRQQQH